MFGLARFLQQLPLGAVQLQGMQQLLTVKQVSALTIVHEGSKVGTFKGTKPEIIQNLFFPQGS